MILLDSLDGGELKKPLKKFDLTVDLTKYLEKTESNEDDEIKYDLVGILSYKNNMYTSVVKKRIDSSKQKQWFTFCKS